MGIKPAIKGILKLSILSCCLMSGACANVKEEQDDSYNLVAVQHLDCNVYLMIFKSGDGCAFKMSQSGPCDSLSMDQFLSYYQSFLAQHKNDILKKKGNYYAFSCYGQVDLTSPINRDAIISVTQKELDVTVSIKKREAEDLVLEVR